MQIVNVLGNDVGQRAPFRLIPNILYRIEVGRVRRKPFDPEPSVAILKESSSRGAMGWQAVPHQNDGTPQMPVNVADKSNEVRAARIVIQELVIQSQPQRPGSSRDGGERRNAVAPVPCSLERSVACRSPHAPPQRLQQKATFIEKNQASLLSEALFLVAAKCRDAIGRWPPRCALGRVARASGDSSPTAAAIAAHTLGDSPRRTVAESCPAPAVRSNHPVHNPNTACRASRRRPIPSVAAMKAWASGLDEALLEACSRASTPSAIGRPMKHWSRRPQPLPSTTYPSRKAWLRSFDELRASRGFLKVSYPHHTALATLSIN